MVPVPGSSLIQTVVPIIVSPVLLSVIIPLTVNLFCELTEIARNVKSIEIKMLFIIYFILMTKKL